MVGRWSSAGRLMHCTYLVMSKLTGSSTAFNFQVRVCSRMKLQVLSVNLVQGRNLLTFIDSSTIYWHLYYWTVCVKGFWFSLSDLSLFSNSYTEAKTLDPSYFLNNFVKKSHSILIMYGAQIPKWICNKRVTKLSTSPNECPYTTLWNNMYQPVYNHSNANIKRHDKLTVTDKHITTNVQSVRLWLWHVH